VIAIDAFLFDLDGTLIDSRLDLAAAVNAALTAQGRPPKPAGLITTYVGDGVARLMARSFESEDPAVLAPATEAFRAHYRAHCLDQTRLYPDVRSTLDHYSDKRFAVVSNKPEDFSRLIVAGIGLGDRITVVVGGGSLPPGAALKPDPAPVQLALARLGVEPASAVLVGDGTTDIEAGRRAGVRTCAVTYGFTNPETLAAARPDHLIHRFAELRDLFI
jgi:phosphoglycolate phosphatase